MAATLSVRPSPGLPGCRELVVDCEHGQTVATVYLPEGCALTEHAAARLAVATHYAAEGCRGTVPLRRRLEREPH